jgi:hypothetical protein
MITGEEKMKKTLLENVIKIANCLKQAENGWLWPTEISNRTGLHRRTVTRLLESFLSNFIEEQKLEPSNIRMFKIKPGVDMNSILKFMSVKEKIDRAMGKH